MGGADFDLASPGTGTTDKAQNHLPSPDRAKAKAAVGTDLYQAPLLAQMAPIVAPTGVSEGQPSDLVIRNQTSVPEAVEAKLGDNDEMRNEQHDQMRRVWGELEFILRQQISSNSDVDAAQK